MFCPAEVGIDVVLGLEKTFCLFHRRVHLDPDFGGCDPDPRFVDAFFVKPVADSVDRFSAWSKSFDDLLRGPMVSEVGRLRMGYVEEHFVETVHVGLLETKPKRQDLGGPVFANERPSWRGSGPFFM